MVFITLRLHGLYQGSLANKRSQKHLVLLNPGILTMFEVGLPKDPPTFVPGASLAVLVACGLLSSSATCTVLVHTSVAPKMS